MQRQYQTMKPSGNTDFEAWFKSAASSRKPWWIRVRMLRFTLMQFIVHDPPDCNRFFLSPILHTIHQWIFYDVRYLRRSRMTFVHNYRGVFMNPWLILCQISLTHWTVLLWCEWTTSCWSHLILSMCVCRTSQNPRTLNSPINFGMSGEIKYGLSSSLLNTGPI